MPALLSGVREKRRLYSVQCVKNILDVCERLNAVLDVVSASK